MRKRYVKKVEDEQRMQEALRAVEKKQLPHMLCVTNMLLHGIENPSFVRHNNTLAWPYVSYTASERALDEPSGILQGSIYWVASKKEVWRGAKLSLERLERLQSPTSERE
jgi:N-6 DNA methylase